MGGGHALLELVTDRAIAAVCAEAVGCMEALKDATLEYLKTRQQFGVPIGRFQVLQHRMVDMLIHLEQARSMAMLAAVKVDSPVAAERRKAVSAAKEFIGRAGRFVSQQAVQLHGGMGVTYELPVGHYMKRLAAIAAASVLAPAMAHHSFAMFDQSRTDTLSGTVTKFEYTSPHAWLFMAVEGKDGKSAEWGFEMGGPQALSRSGWKKNTVVVGDKVTVSFNPLRSGEPGGAFKNGTFADGRPIGGKPKDGEPGPAPQPAR